MRSMLTRVCIPSSARRLQGRPSSTPNQIDQVSSIRPVHLSPKLVSAWQWHLPSPVLNLIYSIAPAASQTEFCFPSCRFGCLFLRLCCSTCSPSTSPAVVGVLVYTTTAYIGHSYDFPVITHNPPSPSEACDMEAKYSLQTIFLM